MKHKKWVFGKPLLFIFSLLYASICIISSIFQTYAALTDVDYAKHSLDVDDFQVAITGNILSSEMLLLDHAYAKEVKVKNESNMEGFVRLLVLPILSEPAQSPDATKLLPTAAVGNVQAVSLQLNQADWIEGSDGYYYYKKKLKKNEQTSALFSSLTINGSALQGNSSVQVAFEFKVEGIHTSAYAYRDAWWQGIVPTEQTLHEVDQLLQTQVLKE